MPAVLCNKCGTDLPDGSEFCLKCGEPVKSAAGADFVVTTATLGCSGCGAKLADEAEFCSRCGKSVSVPTKKKATSPDPVRPVGSSKAVPPPGLPRRRKRPVVLWGVTGLLVVATFWLATSDNPFAQTAQEFAGWKHDQGIVDNAFSISAHNFRYYKFVLPQGSMHVSIVGEFRSAVDPHGGKSAAPRADSNIEVYVMSEAAFVAWQNGYNGTNVYESGRISHGSMQAELRDGAGVYYLVFNNKFAPTAAKQVTADVLLRYKNWLPEYFRRVSERFWNWIGL